MPRSEVTVRPVRADEHDRVGDLLVEAYRAIGGEPDWYLERMRATTRRAAEVPVLVAVDAHDAILGTVTYVPGPGTPFSDVERDDEAGIRAFAVAPEARGLGIGRLLVGAVLDRARADGRSGIAIFTRPRMTAAQRLYESMGFVRAPEQDETFAPGEWLLAYRLRFAPD
jgi:ribosomal protein S18 acetylase RimI-like enzyme